MFINICMKMNLKTKFKTANKPTSSLLILIIVDTYLTHLRQYIYLSIECK
jgi:hypothetical protein